MKGSPGSSPGVGFRKLASRPPCRTIAASGLRRGTRGSHTRTGRERIRSDREEDVRRARVSHWRQHGPGSKRPRWSIGSRRPSAVRHARSDDKRSAHGKARAANAGMATSRPGRPPHQTPACQMGRTWHDIRPLATREAIDPNTYRAAGGFSGRGIRGGWDAGSSPARTAPSIRAGSSALLSTRAKADEPQPQRSAYPFL
jgi:hypothetical protein